MPDQSPNTPEQWRNFNTRFPIKACRLKRDGLKRLYGIIDERQKEYRNMLLSTLLQTPNETPTDFADRKAKVSNAFVTSVTITAENEEVLTGNRLEIFDDPNFPSRLKSVFYSTLSVPQAVLSYLPQNCTTLFLDFSHPPVLDFGRLPTFPTPNESNFEIAAQSAAWFAGTKAKLMEFFDERRSGYEWLHGAGVYDVLLFLVGLPFAVWTCARVETIAPRIDSLGMLPRSLVYCYAFFISLVIFRILFSYARWVFPKVELENGERRSPFRHRAGLATMLLAILGPGLYDLTRTFFKYIFSG